MKRCISYFFLFCFLSLNVPAFSQHFKDAADYLYFIDDEHKAAGKELVFYTSALAHGKNAHKEEPVRKGIQAKLKSASVRIGGMPSFKGDKMLQDTLVSYARTTYAILHTEYPKVVALQDTANKSFEGAQAFAKAKQDALDLIIRDEDRFIDALKAFAGKYSVDLSDNHEDEYEQMLTIKKVSSYYDKAHFIYLKNLNEEVLLAKAIEKKDKEGIEMHNAILMQNVKEGISILDTLKPYKGDRSLADATKQALVFYQKESEFKVPMLLSFLNKGEEYNKAKKDFEAKTESNRTQEEKEKLSRVATEYNDLAATYPNTVNDLNLERPKATAEWNKVSQAFLKKYLP